MRAVNNASSRPYKKDKNNKASVLGIAGSPRHNGNSEILLDKALEGAANAGAITEKIIINDYKFIACQACTRVRDDGYCSINDDFQKIYLAVKKTDIIILSSPIFFGSLSAQVKMMIDRFQCYWRAKYVLKNIEIVDAKTKSGSFLCVQAGQRDDFFANARSIVKNFFTTIGASYCEELLCPGIEAKGSILSSPGTLQKAYDIGKGLVLNK